MPLNRSVGKEQEHQSGQTIAKLTLLNPEKILFISWEFARRKLKKQDIGFV